MNFFMIAQFVVISQTLVGIIVKFMIFLYSNFSFLNKALNPFFLSLFSDLSPDFFSKSLILRLFLDATVLMHFLFSRKNSLTSLKSENLAELKEENSEKKIEYKSLSER